MIVQKFLKGCRGNFFQKVPPASLLDVYDFQLIPSKIEVGFVPQLRNGNVHGFGFDGGVIEGNLIPVIGFTDRREENSLVIEGDGGGRALSLSRGEEGKHEGFLIKGLRHQVDVRICRDAEGKASLAHIHMVAPTVVRCELTGTDGMCRIDGGAQEGNLH